MGKDARWVATYTTKNYGVALCAECAQKRKQATAAGEVDAGASTEGEPVSDGDPVGEGASVGGGASE